MEENVIRISKKPGIKNCVRINSEKDIPEFLKEVVKVEGENLILDCMEGEEKAPVGSVIAYEKLDSGKMNVWNKANWKETTKEINGVFYELPKINQAIKVTDTLPEEIINKLGDRFKILEDGTLQITTSWGLASCAPYNGYLVIYGNKEDGSLDANFLSIESPSFKEYFVVDENNNLYKTLEEYDNEHSNNMNL